MTDETNLDDLLLDWEEQQLSSAEIRAFCESRGITHETTVRELTRRADALDRITGFLSDRNAGQSGQVSSLDETRLETTSQIDVRPVFATGGRSAIHPGMENPIGRPIALKTLLRHVPDRQICRARLAREAPVAWLTSAPRDSAGLPTWRVGTH